VLAPTTVTALAVRPTIDGSQTPELVPNDTAYRHFILAAAVPSLATQGEISRRDGYLRLVGLTPVDTAAVVAALATVREEVEEIKGEQVRHTDGSVESRQNLSELTRQRAAVLNAARLRLHSGLSADGRAKVDDFVRGRIKPRIKIYGAQ
jgi:hypothetical protein